MHWKGVCQVLVCVQEVRRGELDAGAMAEHLREANVHWKEVCGCWSAHEGWREACKAELAAAGGSSGGSGSGQRCGGRQRLDQLAIAAASRVETAPAAGKASRENARQRSPTHRKRRLRSLGAAQISVCADASAAFRCRGAMTRVMWRCRPPGSVAADGSCPHPLHFC